MVLDIINTYIDQYKLFITSDKHAVSESPYGIVGLQYQDWIGNWKSLKVFQDNWNIDTDDFKSMYASSFANTLSNDLWEGHSFFPKKAMLTFIDRDPDLIRSMFKELFNEHLDIEGRIDRFVHHCDELCNDIMRSDPGYQNHYHEGYRMISVYLAFHFPMNYTVYNIEDYKDFMAKVKAKAVAGTGDIGRFFKVMRTVYSILAKDEELLSMHQHLRAGHEDLYQGASLLLVREFYWFCSNLNAN